MTKPTDPSYHWSGAELDLDAYLTRIGFDGEHKPTVETLQRLVYLHTTSIPFENLEIILGRGIDLDLETLQDKLVRRRRGGYCYENVQLFAAALERLGFGVTGLSGRVTLGAPGLRPGTHALLRITTSDDERAWLVDVGFGAGPLQAIELTHSPAEFTAGEWRFRLERTSGELGNEQWVLHQFGRGGWVDRYTFTLNPQYRIDFRVGNHFVSTSPSSPFTARPFVQRFHPDVHYVLDDLTFITERPDGSGDTREVKPAELPQLLSEVFDIDLDAADAAKLTEVPWRN
ncbi:arylamine N-acetyltransferase [Nocardia sp. XZ_19_385]|uniref:arylamine N-acetyltransferase family protein n=1 Tax=Nocardia sp. XZ_19_385 TaxID=2769488 RepID=UPI00188F4A9D|nr:arylamine N-acetyltransferase [Nocardia sp. XZ_19_385]